MSDVQIKTLSRYALYALGGALVAAGLKLGQELAGTGDIGWREIASVLILSFCGTMATAAGTSTLVRPGSETLAAQVDAYKSIGYHRDELAVVPQADTMATRSVLLTISAMNHDDLARVRDVVMARHETLASTPSGVGAPHV